MKVGGLIWLGLLAGMLGGGVLGMALGLAWVELLDTGNFEDFTAMLVFFTFSPIGAVLGGITGAAMPGLRALQTPDFFPDSTAGDPTPGLTAGLALEPVRDRSSLHRSFKPDV